MNQVCEPKIYLMSRPQLAEGMEEFCNDSDLSIIKNKDKSTTSKTWEIPTFCSDAELLCMVAGKVCYNSFGQGRNTPNEYIKNLLDKGHESVLEHANWSFLIRGVSRTFSHEHVRHRIGVAISQRSQRYVKESDASIITQNLLLKSPKASQVFEDAVDNSQRAYSSLVDILEEDLKKEVPDTTLRRKIVRSAARSVLPNALETVLMWTANGRALRHYIKLRCSEHAEIEIRKVSGLIFNIMKEEAPSLFQDFEKYELGDGTFAVKQKN